jgi:ribosomal-protein-alanine N-acetyltransferase
LDSPDPPPGMHVRALEPRDVRAVLAIQKASPEAAQWTAADYAHIDQTATQAWIAETEASSEALAVHPDYRGRGTASILLKAAIVRARESGAAKIFLEVRESNAAAISFYKRFGFNAAGCRPHYYGNPDENALILALVLASAP